MKVEINEMKKNKLTLSLIVFTGLTFLLTWFLMLLVILKNHGYLSIQLPFNLLLVIGSWIPNLICFFLLLVILKDKKQFKKLIKKWIAFKAPFAWYISSMIPLIIIAILAVFIQIFDVSSFISFEKFTLTEIISLIVIIFITGALGEELGWRGFMLPRLLMKRNALVSSVIIGFVWSLWHLPLWFSKLGYEHSSFVLFTMIGVCFSVIATWISVNTKGNMFLVCLSHAALNLSMSLILEGLIYYVILLVAATLIIIIRCGYKTLSKSKRLLVHQEDYGWI
jgi:uncharacterized protein